jgi:hypothetical protein
MASKDESDGWIEHAIQHHGALKAKAENAGKSTQEYAEEHKTDGGVTGHQARLGLTLMNMHHEGYSLEKPSKQFSTEEMPKSD